MHGVESLQGDNTQEYPQSWTRKAEVIMVVDDILSKRVKWTKVHLLKVPAGRGHTQNERPRKMFRRKLSIEDAAP